MVAEFKNLSSGGFLANVAERVIDPLAETDPGSLQVSSWLVHGVIEAPAYSLLLLKNLLDYYNPT